MTDVICMSKKNDPPFDIGKVKNLTNVKINLELQSNFIAFVRVVPRLFNRVEDLKFQL